MQQISLMPIIRTSNLILILGGGSAMRLKLFVALVSLWPSAASPIVCPVGSSLGLTKGQEFQLTTPLRYMAGLLASRCSTQPPLDGGYHPERPGFQYDEIS
jgi:hypothetical protein